MGAPPANLSPAERDRNRLENVYLRLHERIGKKTTNTYTFGPSPIGLCAVKGLLIPCAQVTGKRYLLARDAWLWVDFGHTNALNGVQWVAAVEQALRDNGLVFFTNEVGVVKVIPKTGLDDYRKAGLVKDGE